MIANSNEPVPATKTYQYTYPAYLSARRSPTSPKNRIFITRCTPLQIILPMPFIQRSSCQRFRIRTNPNFPQILPRLCASHSCTRLRVNARSRNWHPIPIWVANNPSPASIVPTPNIDSAFDWSNCIQRRVHWSCHVSSKVHLGTTGTWWLARPKCTADLISCNCVSYLWKTRPFSALT